MINTDDFRGVICPLVTPFDETGQIDEDSLGSLIEYVIEGGVQGVMLAGTTGEGMLLSVAERKQLTEFVTQKVASRIKVIVHTGRMDTQSTIELGHHAVDVGADAIAAIVPYFFTYDSQSIYLHFKTLGDALPDIPLFPYVFPGNAKNDIEATLFHKLVADVPSIVGIKSSNPDLIRLRSYINTSDRLSIFCGVDGLMLAGLVEGARGQVSGNANVFPAVISGLYNNYCSGDIDGAREKQNQIDTIRAILCDGLHPAYFKTVLKRKNIIKHDTVRRPMRDLTSQEYDELIDQLEHFETSL